MSIVVHEDNTGFAPKDCRFTAIEDDTYEGSTSIGYGSTESEAILDLIEIMFDECEITEDEAQELMRIHGVPRGMWHWAKRA